MGNKVLFAVWNRPEMLQIVMEHWLEAYNHHPIKDLEVIFAVEGGDMPPKIRELIEGFDFPKEILWRPKHFGLSRNILEGLKYAMNKTDDWVMFQADDIVVHKKFFEYNEAMFNLDPGCKVSNYSSCSYKKEGDANAVHKSNFYDAAGACLTKEWFVKYINPLANEKFYKNRVRIICALDEKFKSHGAPEYKYSNRPRAEHNEQAGLLNRLADVALIKEGMHVIVPELARVRNIGFYGKNRGGTDLPKGTYEERLEILRECVADSRKLFSMTKYFRDDYVDFGPSLDAWDGTLNIEEDLYYGYGILR